MGKLYLAISLCVFFLDNILFISPVSSALRVENNSTNFRVCVDNVEVFSHSNSNPIFYLSGININFTENEGNWIIKETTEFGPTALNNFFLYGESGENDSVIWTATLSNSGENEDTSTFAVLKFWEGDAINGVQLGLHFEILMQSPNSLYNRITMRIPSTDTEYIYGLGEQFTDFNMNGHKYTIWTREQGVGRNLSDPLTQLVELGQPGRGGDHDYTYWPQPTFVSSQRYLFALESNAYSIFNFENLSYKEISIQSTSFSGYFVVDQNSLLSLVQNVSKIFGRQPELPEWVSSGAILGVQGGTDKMLQYINEAEEHGVAVSAMWIQDWSGKITTSFGTRVFWNWEWNKDWYPNLDVVIPELKATKNIRVLSYINPSLNIEGNVFEEGDALGYFLRREENLNATYVQDFGEYWCATLDVWNSEAVNWYKGIIKKNMLEIGFSGWMADFGEYTPITAATINSTIELDGQERHNLLPILWAKINREAVEEAGLLNETMYWTRAGGSGASRYSTMLWGGDQNVNWSFSDGLPSTITAAFSAAMSGMGLFHFDIGGFTTIQLLNLVRSKELLLRSAEYAVFTPVMRTHEGNQPAANHQVYSDTDTWTKFGRLTQIFRMLSNYSRVAIRQNSLEGIPVMRPLFLQYESDPASFRENYQYLYGDDLLVAPVLFSGSQQRSVYLPPDEWVHLWDADKAVLVGPLNVTVESPLGYPPVFYRRGSTWTYLFDEICSRFS